MHFAKHNYALYSRHFYSNTTLFAFICRSVIWLYFSPVSLQATTGLVVNILSIAVLTAALNTIALPIFSLSSFPEWAQPINGTTNTSFVCWRTFVAKWDKYIACTCSPVYYQLLLMTYFLFLHWQACVLQKGFYRYGDTIHDNIRI